LLYISEQTGYTFKERIFLLDLFRNY